MRALIDPQCMQRCEGEYFRSSGVASIEVMERAARALANVIRRRFPEAKRICVACGPGGNGGDGYACARLLQQEGREVRIFPAAAPRSADALANAGRARDCGIPFCEPGAWGEAPELWLDCLYGTGFSRAPSGTSAELIGRMNRDRSAGARTLAADIPSGLDGRTGVRALPCVEADCTVSFQFAKYGQLLRDGLDVCGALEVCDVGFPASAFPEALPLQLLPEDVGTLLAPRRRNSHKGSCGHVLIVAGSPGMAGAAVLCTRAALRSGAGLVTVACPRSIAPILQALAPCALCLPLPERDGVLAPEAAGTLETALPGKSSVVIGPGLRQSVPPELPAPVLRSGLPCVIDADALNLLAREPSLRALLRPQHVLTPHPGEAARLLGHPCADPMADAQELAKLGATAVYKGASRVIASAAGSDVAELFLSASGAAGMARGGSGDIYAGVLGALLAEPSGRTIAQSAAAACELHGLAGELAQKKYGPRAMNAADLLEFLPEAFTSCGT